jgi:hypothetical protein
MQRHVRRTVWLGWGLLTLGAVDLGSIFGGVWIFGTVYAGSLLGSALATRKEMWRKWDKKTENLDDDD